MQFVYVVWVDGEGVFVVVIDQGKVVVNGVVDVLQIVQIGVVGGIVQVMIGVVVDFDIVVYYVKQY